MTAPNTDAVEGLVAKCRAAKANGDPAKYMSGLSVKDAWDIAAALPALLDRVEALEAALRPFVLPKAVRDDLPDEKPVFDWMDEDTGHIARRWTVGDFRAARALLGQADRGAEG